MCVCPDDVDDRWDEYVADVDPSEANFLIHVRPQHHYVRDADGRVAVDHVLRFEHLRDDIAPILRQRGLDAGHLRNDARPIELPGDLDPEQVERIDRIYASDFELLPYEPR